MYRNLKIAVVIPCYNEEKLITKTIETLPKFIDHVIAVNDASTDNTLSVLRSLARKDSRLKVIDNKTNGGTGFSLKAGFTYAIAETDSQAIGIASGDAQCPPQKMKPMLDEFIDRSCDYVKGNRFFDRKALKLMPKYRRIGNTFISLLTKFSTGYYSVSDITMSFGFIRRNTLEIINFDLVKDRYDYENSMLIALSIAGARIKDYPVSAIYGDEVSTINFWGTTFRVLKVIWVGFWQRIYYKYILFNFHPVALFLLAGLLLSTVGWLYALFLFFEKTIRHLSPSTGTVMIAVLPIILGFQLLLTSLLMDMNNEDTP